MIKATSRDALKLLQDGSIALAKIEANGIKIDEDYLEQATAKNVALTAELEAELKRDDTWKAWKRRWGERANLGSDTQLAEVLYKVLKIPCTAWTPSGRPAVHSAALRGVDLPVVRKLTRMNKLKDAKSKYLDGLKRVTVDGYFHPNFNLHTARTFRSSSGSDKQEKGGGGKDLNFQSLPVRDPELADLVRRMFIPRRSSWLLVECDFSTIEVRVGCASHEDPKLMDYVEHSPPNDMHGDTAADLFLLRHDQVEKRPTRDWAKNKFVFPQFYGQVWFNCAPNIWAGVLEEHVQWHAKHPEGLKKEGKGPLSQYCSVKDHLASEGVMELGDCVPNKRPRAGTFEAIVKEAQDQMWDSRFPVYRDWKERYWRQYLKRGGFRVLTGFYIEGLYSRNDVTNYPVQSIAFHCLLWSLTKLQQWLDKYKMRCRIVGQIHDSLLLDCPPDEIQDVLNAAREIMTVLLPRAWRWINTSLDTECDVSPPGKSWHEKALWTNEKGVWAPKAKG